MKISAAEVVVWNETGQAFDWYWELTVDGAPVGRGLATAEGLTRDIAWWMAHDLTLPDGSAIVLRDATPQEVTEREAENRWHAQFMREQHQKGLGLVEPRRKKTLDDLLEDSGD